MYNKHLDAFVLTAELGSFSKAAEKLFISTQALMKQINLLEKELGIKLFLRSNKGVFLTEAGKSIYDDAILFIKLSRQSLEKARQIENSQKQVIRIGSSLLYPCAPIINLWATIGAHNTDIILKVISMDDYINTKLAILDKLEQDVDVLVGTYPSNIWNKPCKALELTRLPLRLTMSRKHRLAGKKVINTSDLTGETVLLPKQNLCFAESLEKNYPHICWKKVAPYDINTFNQCELTGILLLTIDIWKGIHPALTTVACNWDYDTPYGIIYSENPSEHVKHFLDEVKKYQHEFRV